MVFEVPKTWSKTFHSDIVVENLGDFCYPSLYLLKNELEDIPEKWEDLVYPQKQDKTFYDLKFGDNFSYQLYNDRVSINF